MKKLLLSILAIFATAAVYAQPFLTGNTQIVFQDPSRNNRNIEAEIYYPADVAGSGVPVSINGSPYPVVVFGHGFVMTWTAYENIWLALTEAGFIVVFPKTESGFAPDHTDFGRDIAFLVTALQNEGLNSGSLFYNMVDSTSAVMGHSMGGGSSFLAVQYNPGITAVANLAAAETNPSAIAACANITIPALVIAGANDCITPPATNQLAMYNALASNCKTYISITGASHCQFANSNFNCSFGELTCSPGPSISRAAQHALVNQLLIPWLNFQLKNDCNAGIDFETLVVNPSGFTALKNCVLCTPSGVDVNHYMAGFHVYPNVTNDAIHISSSLAPVKNATFQIVDLKGKTITAITLDMNQHEVFKLLIGSYPSGIYFLKISGDGIHSTVNKIIKI